MSTVTEYVFRGSSGANDIQLQDDSSAGVMSNSDSSGWTRVVVSNGVLTVDSSITPTAVVWNTTGKITMTLGGLVLTPGVYRNCYVKVYSVNYPSGVVYGVGDNNLTIKVT